MVTPPPLSSQVRCSGLLLCIRTQFESQAAHGEISEAKRHFHWSGNLVAVPWAMLLMHLRSPPAWELISECMFAFVPDDVARSLAGVSSVVVSEDALFRDKLKHMGKCELVGLNLEPRMFFSAESDCRSVGVYSASGVKSPDLLTAGIPSSISCDHWTVSWKQFVIGWVSIQASIFLCC